MNFKIKLAKCQDLFNTFSTLQKVGITLGLLTSVSLVAYFVSSTRSDISSNRESCTNSCDNNSDTLLQKFLDNRNKIILITLTTVITVIGGKHLIDFKNERDVEKIAQEQLAKENEGIWNTITTGICDFASWVWNCICYFSNGFVYYFAKFLVGLWNLICYLANVVKTHKWKSRISTLILAVALFVTWDRRRNASRVFKYFRPDPVNQNATGTIAQGLQSASTR